VFWNMHPGLKRGKANCRLMHSYSYRKEDRTVSLTLFKSQSNLYDVPDFLKIAVVLKLHTYRTNAHHGYPYLPLNLTGTETLHINGAKCSCTELTGKFCRRIKWGTGSTRFDNKTQTIYYPTTSIDKPL